MTETEIQSKLERLEFLEVFSLQCAEENAYWQAMFYSFRDIVAWGKSDHTCPSETVKELAMAAHRLSFGRKP